jgi:hypothetical protein
MKHNHNHDNARSAGLQLMPVRFEFTYPTATTFFGRGHIQRLAPHHQIHASDGGRSLAEGNGLAAQHLRTLPGGGRQIHARSAGQRDRAQPVWREKLDSEGGQLAQREKLYEKYAHIKIDVSEHEEGLVSKILSEYKKMSAAKGPGGCRCGHPMRLGVLRGR